MYVLVGRLTKNKVYPTGTLSKNYYNKLSQIYVASTNELSKFLQLEIPAALLTGRIRDVDWRKYEQLLTFIKVIVSHGCVHVALEINPRGTLCRIQNILDLDGI